MSSKNKPPAQAEGAAKVSVSFPPELLEKIDHEAAKDRRPRSQWIAMQLERLFAEDPSQMETNNR